MKCFSLILGVRHTGRKGGRFRNRDDTLIHQVTRRHFPEGFTILRSSGGWFDPERGKFVNEESRQILICASHRARVRGWCGDLAVRLRQKELLVVEVGEAIFFRTPRAVTAPGPEAKQTGKSGKK